MNPSAIINDDMTLEEKLEAIKKLKLTACHQRQLIRQH